jgi:hypothetical protein
MRILETAFAVVSLLLWAFLAVGTVIWLTIL